MNKTLNILTQILTTRVPGIPIDIEVKFDVTGKVYSTNILLFELPESAQLLTLGKRTKAIKREIRAYERSLQLRVPLIISEVFGHYDVSRQGHESFIRRKQEYSNILSAVRKECEEQGLDVKQLHHCAEPESLQSTLLTARLDPSSYPQDFKDKLTNIVYTFEQFQYNMQSVDIEFFAKNYSRLHFQVMCSMISYYKDAGMKSSAYWYLGNYNHQDCVDFLVQEMETCRDGQELRAIFSALSRQKLTDQKIQEKLIRAYESDIFLNGKAKTELMRALKQFPNQKTFDVGMEIVEQKNVRASSTVAAILLNIGYRKEKIVEPLLVKLTGEDIEMSCEVFIKFEELELHNYFPDTEKLLQIIIRNFTEQEVSDRFLASVAKVIIYKNDEKIIARIIDLFKTAEDFRMQGILGLIYELLRQKGFDLTPLTTPALKTKYIELFKQNDSTLEKAAYIIEELAKYEKDNKYITILLQEFEFYKEENRNYKLLLHVNNILSHVEYDSSFSETFFKIINSPKMSREHVMAFRALSFTRDKNVINFLEEQIAGEKRFRDKIQIIQLAIEGKSSSIDYGPIQVIVD